MKLMKALAVSAILLSSAVAANAADYNLGTLTTPSTVTFGPNSVAAGSFLDKIFFSLADPSNTSIGTGQLTLTLNGTWFDHISDLSANLFKSDNTWEAGGLDFSVSNLANGDYYLKVKGLADGSAGGLYGGAINLSTVTPVPEPSVWGTLLAGLVLMGFMAFRRKETH